MAECGYAKKATKKLSKNFNYRVKEAEKKNNLSKRGRLTGGQLIGIRNSLKDEWSVCEWAYGMILKLQKDTCIITIYININFTSVEDSLKCAIEEGMKDFDVIIISGDCNARVGCSQMCNRDDEDVVPSKRESQDKTMRMANGLVKLLKNLGSSC